MNKLGFLALIQVFIIFSTTIAHCRETRFHVFFSELNTFKPATDTIYQIDTVYQYVIVYDTLYYYDSPQETDTTAVVDTIIEHTDSTVVINNRLTLNLKGKKTVLYNQDLKFIENPTREFDDLPEESRNKQQNSVTPPISETREKKRRKQPEIKQEEGKNHVQLDPITYFVKDTIFFYDTVITHEWVYDTLFFRSRDANADTTITQSVEFEKMGKLVMAIETVKYTINRRENVFAEKNSRSVYRPHQSVQDNNLQRKTSGAYSSASQTKISHRRKNTRFAPREFHEKNVDYTTLLLGSISAFEPSVTFSAENDDANEYTHSLNSNSEARTSWGTSFTYGYFQNRLGYETGLGYSKHNFGYNHAFEETDIDSTQFWEYFNKEIYHYDTTWYLNIDTLLQTGDTLLVPSVDSILIQVTDSILRKDYDTTFFSKSARYNYSYSYLEIPLIGRFQLFEGKLSAHVAAGVIPTFLVSKSGKMPMKNTGSMADAGEITYDYGFSLSGYCALSFLYRFYDDYSLFVEPYIKRNLYTTLKNDQFLMKNNSWGIRFGLSYTLFTTKNRKLR